MKKTLICICFSCLGVSAFNATASTVAVALNTSTGSLGALAEGTLGWQFLTNADISVTHLGFYDHEGDGLQFDHEIGIWDASQTLLTSTLVPSGTTTPLTNGFRYVPITPTALSANQVFVIGATDPNSSSEIWAYDSLGTPTLEITTAPELSVQAGRFIQGVGTGTTLTYPMSIWNGEGFEDGFYGPNFQFETAVVPIPAAAPLFGSVMGLMGYLGWRKKKQVTA